MPKPVTTLNIKQYIYELDKANSRAQTRYRQLIQEEENILALGLAFKKAFPAEFEVYIEEIKKRMPQTEDTAGSTGETGSNTNNTDSTDGQQARSGETSHESAVEPLPDSSSSGDDIRGA